MQEEIHPGRTTLIRLLHEASDRFGEELGRRVAAAGFGDLRETHGCVFSNVPPEGARLTWVADQARLTKQAVGEVATELERLGYLERLPDPSDGRAKILRLTERGREAQRTGFQIIAALEQEWAERYGEDKLAAMREVLEEVAGLRAPTAA
jgi:DNA-binding MarR family transcriptional regulator